MNIDIDLVSRIIELIFGMATTIFLFVIMVYRLSYRLNDLSEKFKENNQFIREFKTNFENFKLSTSEQLAEIKVTVSSIEKNFRSKKHD